MHDMPENEGMLVSGLENCVWVRLASPSHLRVSGVRVRAFCVR